MKAIDFRDANFEAIRGGLDESRRRVYEAWVKWGPATTLELSRASGIPLLSLRPRTTEMVQIGLLSVVTTDAGKAIRRKREGVYGATPMEEWERWRAEQITGQQGLI